MTTFQPDDRIGVYRVVRPLGTGGIGAVYEVVHEKLGVHYALKTFTLDHGHVQLPKERFLAEGRILARQPHDRLDRRGIRRVGKVNLAGARQSGGVHTAMKTMPGLGDRRYGGGIRDESGKARHSDENTSPANSPSRKPRMWFCAL